MTRFGGHLPVTHTCLTRVIAFSLFSPTNHLLFHLEPLSRAHFRFTQLISIFACLPKVLNCSFFFHFFLFFLFCRVGTLLLSCWSFHFKINFFFVYLHQQKLELILFSNISTLNTFWLLPFSLLCRATWLPFTSSFFFKSRP